MLKARWLPWAGILAMLVIVAMLFRHDRNLSQRIRDRDKNIAVLEYQVDSLGAREDSLLQRFKVTYDTLWLPSRLRIDTLADTVEVPVEVVREIVRDADSTIQACSITLSTCRARALAQDALVDSLHEQVSDLKRGPMLSGEAYGATDLQGDFYLGVQGKTHLFGVEVFGRLETPLDSIGITKRVGISIPF